MIPSLRFLLLFSFLLPLLVQAGTADGVIKVVAQKTEIQITVYNPGGTLRIVELDPNEATRSALRKSSLSDIEKKGRRTIKVSRFDGKRDRIYSAFVAVNEEKPLGAKRFVEEWKAVSEFNEPYPKTSSKKGLQVQMVEDAIALGVKHAALNLNFGNIISLRGSTNDIPFQMDGRTFHFRRGAVEGFDRRVKTLSDAGMTVTLILLYYENPDPELNKIMLHPDYDR
ncbi:MAG: DUF5722 domain-containing protein, partial [Limisphaerales bacterium]